MERSRQYHKTTRLLETYYRNIIMHQPNQMNTNQVVKMNLMTNTLHSLKLASQEGPKIVLCMKRCDLEIPLTRGFSP